MMGLLLGLLLPCLGMYFLLQHLFHDEQSGFAEEIVKGSLGIGLGLGVSSCAFFLYRVAGGSPSVTYCNVESLCWTGLIVVAAAALRWKNVLGPARVARPLPNRFLVIVTCVVLACGFIALCVLIVKSPHGDWDAWCIWNMRARFLMTRGEHWTAGFSSEIGWTHPDYPLLVSASVARAWTYAGRQTPLAPQLLALLFPVATLGMLVASLSVLRCATRGMLAGMLLIATPFYLLLASAQYADVPIGFYMLATVCCLGFAERTSRTRWFVLAGLLAGFAAWTKNEGLLFVCVVSAVRFLIAVRESGGKRALQSMLPFLLGLAPVFAVVVLHKLHYAPPNDIMSGQGWRATLVRILDGPRYIEILLAFARELIEIGPGLIPLLVVYFLLVGRDTTVGSRELRQSGAVLLLMVLGYAGVYVVTPSDLDWHLATSLDRVLMQVWPLALFTFFLTVTTPTPSGATSGVPLPEIRSGEDQR